MSKGALILEIRKELSNINEQIDLRIVRGRAYKDLGRRHKMLLSQLSRLGEKAGKGWLNPSFKFLSLF